MSDPIYIVSATNEDGVVLLEVFNNKDDALAFEKNDAVDRVRKEYNDRAVSPESGFQVGFHIRTMNA